ncbi:protein of unknown function [Chryseobacterium sp. JV274]|nr:protein of unknown function [Chryseobacterium sp. JV274]
MRTGRYFAATDHMSISYYDFNNLSRESQIELVMEKRRIINETINKE